MTIRMLLILLISFWISACHTQGADDEHGHDHDHADAHESPDDRGPHGGRMLREESLAVELAIVEDGIPPEFRAWLTVDGQPVALSDAALEVRLTRLGGAVDTHRFAAAGDYLRSDTPVAEPHSFDVDVQAQLAGRTHQWRYSTPEGRTTISASMAAESGIRVAPAGPGVIRDQHEVQGLLTPVEGRHARIAARFPGPIRQVNVSVGDRIAQGQTLATVESNASLSAYAVVAPFAGVVLARHASVGEMAGEAPLFEIADLSQLWVDLHLFGSDAQHITAGLPVMVERLSDRATLSTTLERVLPATATASQSTVARASIANADGHWRPGAAVRARVTVAEDAVPLVVPLAALQRFRDWEVVFVQVGDDYEFRPLELGRRDGEHVEVLSGLSLGDRVVIEQSYLVKADIEKSAASHDH